MSDQTTSIISKVWGMCGPLRDDGVSYGDYLEQLTYLIFLKMSDEYAKPPYKKETGPCRLHMVGYEHADRRGAGSKIQGDPRKARRAGRHPRADFQGRHQQSQQRRDPLPHRADDRQGEVGLHVLRR